VTTHAEMDRQCYVKTWVDACIGIAHIGDRQLTTNDQPDNPGKKSVAYSIRSAGVVFICLT